MKKAKNCTARVQASVVRDGRRHSSTANAALSVSIDDSTVRGRISVKIRVNAAENGSFAARFQSQSASKTKAAQESFGKTIAILKDKASAVSKDDK